MKKIIPIFHLPQEYPHEMKTIVQGLVANDGKQLKSVVLWLKNHLTVQKEGKTFGNPKSKPVIENYLRGFYAIDLFKQDDILYYEANPETRLTSKHWVRISSNSRIRVIKPLFYILNSPSIEAFNEYFNQICFRQSQIVRTYISDRQILKEKHNIPDNPNISLLRQLLVEHCNYSYIGNPGIGYLDRFYIDKIQINSYLQLMQFIINNFSEYAKNNMGLVPISNVLNFLKEVSDFRDDEIKTFLIRLRITNRIELRVTKSQLAENLGIELIDIQGIKYGFIKILDYTTVC